MPSLRVALLGAGIFSRDAWLGCFSRSAETAELVAVWSRSKEASEGLLPSIKEFNSDVKAYSGDGGLDELLACKDIDAVVIVLPVQVMLGVTKKALDAGKHVLQEKPIAPNVAKANNALAEYRVVGLSGPVWALAENYRSEKVFRDARAIASSIGKVIKVDLVANMPMNTQNKYFNSAWRRDSQTCPGGFITDSAVHFMGALRMLAKAAGMGEVVEASGVAWSAKPELPPPDSLVGRLHLSQGGFASVSITFASEQTRFSLALIGTEGSLEVQRGGWGESRGEYCINSQRAGESEPVREKYAFTGLDDELSAFVEQVQARTSGKPLANDADVVYRTAPEEGARDLAVVEALLASSEQGGVTITVPLVP